jgi:archaemetzincin
MRRFPLIVALEILVFLDISVQSGVPGKHVLLIQPLGKELPDEEMAAVKQALGEFYNVQIRVLPRVSLPEQAYYQPRRRYRAEKILPFLLERLPSDGDRILGLTGADISTGKGSIEDWGIVGLANLGGKGCIISTYRCRKRSMEGVPTPILLAKVAVHEVGHTLGLRHCATKGCLMEDADGLISTRDREFDICTRCRDKLRFSGYQLPDQTHMPQPQP